MSQQQPSRTYTGPRQYDALKAIKNHWDAFYESPTRSELGRALGISTVSAHLLVKKLARDGLVTVEPKLARGVEVA